MSLGYYGVKFNNWFSETLAFYRPRSVIYEGSIISDNFNIEEARKQFGMDALCETVCEMHHIPCRPANNSTWKKLVAGNGRAKKADVKAAHAANGWHYDSADESDAVGILLWKLHVDGIRPHNGPMFTRA